MQGVRVGQHPALSGPGAGEGEGQAPAGVFRGQHLVQQRQLLCQGHRLRMVLVLPQVHAGKQKQLVYQSLQVPGLVPDDGEVLGLVLGGAGHAVKKALGIGPDGCQGGAQVVGDACQQLLAVFFALALLLHQLLQPLGGGVEVRPHGGKLVAGAAGQAEVQRSLPQAPQPGGKLIEGAFDLFQNAPAEDAVDDKQGQHQAAQGKTPGKQLGTVYLLLEILHGGEALLQQIQPAHAVRQQGKQQIDQQGQGKHQGIGPKQAFFHRHTRNLPNKSFVWDQYTTFFAKKVKER